MPRAWEPSPIVAGANPTTSMSETAMFNERIDAQLQKWLDPNWEQRSFDLGPPIFKGPAVSED